MNISSEEYYFDIGANLTHSAFKSVLDEVIEVSQKNGVQLLSVTGSDLLESQQALAIAKKYPESIMDIDKYWPLPTLSFCKRALVMDCAAVKAVTLSKTIVLKNSGLLEL